MKEEQSIATCTRGSLKGGSGNLPCALSHMFVFGFRKLGNTVIFSIAMCPVEMTLPEKGRKGVWK